MKKPFCKLSDVFKLLRMLVTLVVTIGLLLGLLVEQGSILLPTMLWGIGGSGCGLIALYLAAEFIGVRHGYIEDDLGSPPDGGGGARSKPSKNAAAAKAGDIGKGVFQARKEAHY